MPKILKMGGYLLRPIAESVGYDVIIKKHTPDNIDICILHEDIPKVIEFLIKAYIRGLNRG